MSRTLADLDWPRRTARLVLRPLRPDDLPALHAYRSRDDVRHFMGGSPGPLAEFGAWISRPERAARTLVVERDGVVVGDLMLTVQDAWGQQEVRERAEATEAELGWCLDPAHGGAGLATEAVDALLAIAFEDLGLRRVVALCFAANERSWRLMERVGMRREQHGVEDSLHRDLGWVDGLTYALLAREWRERPERPERPALSGA